MASKGLKRLAFFFIFLVPVVWYLILQLFGSNQFALEKIAELPADCGAFDRIIIVHTSDSLTTARTNYFNRAVQGVAQRETPLVMREPSFFHCVENDEADLLMVSEEGIWGTYELSREGVDRLLTELDILLLQKSYGEGVDR